MMIAARESFAAARRRLPYDAELEYLESTGTQWIDTGVPIRDIYSNPTATIRLMQLKNVGDLFQGIFGCSYSATLTNGGWYCYINGTNFLSIAYGAQATNPTSSASLSRGVFYDVEMRKNVLFIDGEYSGHCELGSSFGNQRLALFTRLSTTTYSNAFVGRISSCSIYNDGVLVRDFIPVRKGNVGYMYDRVTGQLFGNSGTGDFVLGPDVVPVEYIESTGTQWIDTGFAINCVTDVVDLRCVVTSVKSYGTAFGVYEYINGGGMYFGIRRNATQESWQALWGTPSHSLYLETPYDIHYEYGADKCYINETTGSSNANQAYTKPLYVCAMNGQSGAYQYNAQRTYSVSIRRNGALVRDFIPVRVGTVGYMYDRVSRRLFGNSGTGAFIIGPDK